VPGNALIVRDATPDDAAAIQAIYAHHVLHGTGTFEEEPPPVEEIATRLAAVHAACLPYLVAELDGAVAGFAYAGLYHRRSAYRTRWRTRSTSPTDCAAAASADRC
jgi:phosphinothricin acetyltransferase